jgi:hypothetical protein
MNKTVRSKGFHVTFQDSDLQLGSFDHGYSSLCYQRIGSLDSLITTCRNSIRLQDQAVKKELEQRQRRIADLIKDLKKTQRVTETKFNPYSRRKFLADEAYISRGEVRRLMAENRIKLKQARHLAIIN